MARTVDLLQGAFPARAIHAQTLVQRITAGTAAALAATIALAWATFRAAVILAPVLLFLAFLLITIVLDDELARTRGG